MSTARHPTRALDRGRPLTSEAPSCAELAARLAESNACFLAVGVTIAEGMTLHDHEGRIVAANPSAGEILGVSSLDLVGVSLAASHWETVDATQTAVPPERHPISLALATGESPPLALLRLRDRRGALHWLQMRVTPTSASKVARAVCLFTDITAARIDEERRQRTEVNFRTLIEGTPDAVAVYQHDPARAHDPLCYANPRMISLLGYRSADEMLGRAAVDFIHADDRALVDRQVLEAPAAPAPPLTEARFLRGDGEAVPVEMTVLPIFFHGEPATLVHARDLTERKRLEAHVVMADRLASVGMLAAAVGHEINNPLAYVMANLDLVLERLGEPGGTDPDRLVDLAEMLRDARQGAARVRGIVRDLKTFARGESEERTRVDPRRVLDSCVNMAGGEIRQRARLVKRYAETEPVLANAARLGQVLLTLLINAMHAVPLGDRDAHEIQVGTRSDEHGRVVIEVSDTGAGIPDDAGPHLFEPFFTSRTGSQGSGLGLSICRTIVAALGGEITFESRIPRGTTFRVTLPPAPIGSDPPSMP